MTYKYRESSEITPSRRFNKVEWYATQNRHTLTAKSTDS